MLIESPFASAATERYAQFRRKQEKSSRCPYEHILGGRNFLRLKYDNTLFAFEKH